MFKLKTLLFSCCTAQSSQDINEELASETYIQKQETQNHTNKHVAKQHNNKEIPDEEISNGPKLKLTAIEGSLLPLNSEFLINPGGLATGGRGKQDGETYIGFIRKQEGDATIINDIVLDDSSVGTHHCMIKYHLDKKKYFLHDLGEGSGTFYKIEKDLELRSGYIISFGESHMLIHTRDPDIGSDEDCGEDKRGNLSIKFLDGPKVEQVFRFKGEETKTVMIGRMQDCQIKFDDNSLSRYQCTFNYINGLWYIIDGLVSKPSTNGTWLLVDSWKELSDANVIKIGQTLFKVEVESGTQQ